MVTKTSDREITRMQFPTVQAARHGSNFIMYIRKEGPVDIVKYATYKVFHKLLDKGYF